MRVELGGSFRDLVGTSLRDLTAATQAGVRAAAEGLKLELRQHIAAALGARAGNMLGVRVYPSGRDSLRAAASFFARGEKAAAILESFERGEVIRSTGGFWLALPTQSVPALGRGVPVTPRAVEAYFGRRLRFVYTGRNVAFLMLDNVVAGRNGRGVRNATRRRQAQGRQARDVVMFILVRQVRMPRRLVPGPIIEQWAARVPELIQRSMPRQR